MSTPRASATLPTPSSPEEAMRLLVAMPPLAELDMTFTAIGPDQDGATSGFRIKLTVDAKAAISELAQATRERLEDAALVRYGPAVLIPPQHWMHVNQLEVATLTAIEDVVRKQDLKPFDGKSDFASTIKMVAAQFVAAGHVPVTFYRVADSLLQLRKSRMLGLVQEGDVFDRLEPADVLLLRPEFEVVVVGGYAFFGKKATFERAFGFLEELRKESLTTFNAVTRNLRVVGMEALRAACTSQPQMMAKMASIRRSMEEDPGYAKAMTMPKLIAYIEKHPHVDIEIIGTGNGRELVFDPKPTRRFQIVKLLDDDFLRSVLTEREYEAGSKIQSI
ncbi:MAG: Kiwa anti-phage protein KwaB-like domain-containing protein [Actinomycetota bacterium]